MTREKATTTVAACRRDVTGVTSPGAKSHYESVAAGGAYESAVFYSPDTAYSKWMTERCLSYVTARRWLQHNKKRQRRHVSTENVVEEEEEEEEEEDGGEGDDDANPAADDDDDRKKAQKWACHRLVDIGGGTGTFTARLARAVGIIRGEKEKVVETKAEAEVEDYCFLPRCYALCVDPCPEMIRHAKTIPGLMTTRADAFTFATRTDVLPYDVALLKEVVHHISLDDVDSVYAGLHRQLAPGGKVLTVTRPRELPTDYPLFAACRDVWRANQGAHDVYEAAMRRAGFVHVATREETYVHVVPTWRWIDMVRSRFWSTLSEEHFTEEALARGVEELERRYAGQDEVVVQDVLLFLVGEKIYKQQQQQQQYGVVETGGVIQVPPPAAIPSSACEEPPGGIPPPPPTRPRDAAAAA